MASIRVCDGCNGHEVGEMAQRGFVESLDYCEKCAATFDAYSAERDLLHSDIVLRWNQRLGDLRVKFQENHPHMKFPHE